MSAPEDTLRLPDGREVPADLPGLLGNHQRAVSKLLVAGVETSEQLLALTYLDLTHSTGGVAMAGLVRATLARHQPGVELGCLAVEERPRERGPPDRLTRAQRAQAEREAAYAAIIAEVEGEPRVPAVH